ncbi:MAG: hypothetical protein DSY46_00990 [Hydrogenimonas sp.]|nr:MAG: hypothetical protein DSY46_00990 [Hydrogenimonas sp.]
MIKILSTLLLLALFGGLFAWWQEGIEALINFEVGFFSGTLVLAASTFGYWQMVSGSSESSPHHDLPDIVDQIDDRYGLWEEYQKTPTQDVKAILQEEKQRLKKQRRSFKEFLKTTKPALSIYRIVAYGILVTGVLTLISYEIFAPVTYLIGAGLAPLATAVVLWVSP